MDGANKNMIYICSNCDSQFPKWQGQCPECGKWGTVTKDSEKKAGKKKAEAAIDAAKPFKLSQGQSKKVSRLNTNIKELDRVLGGGIVPGSILLLGGDPGIGKSTLILQAASLINEPVIYISAEESADQVRMRLDRLKLNGDKIDFLPEENVETLCKTIKQEKPALAIIDSIQTVYSDDIDAEPGNISQIRTATVKFLETAKKNNIPIVLIGHVTKDGQLAGPKALEHLVDAVLYLEGDQNHHFRVLRTVKNRFGSTKEVGIFDMQDKGLVEVKDPSKIFLENKIDAPGSCLTAVIEGSRVFPIEVQALVSKTIFGYPQRKASGFDVNRLQLLTAVLSKRAKLPLGTQDIHVNITGGLKTKDPAVDLAVCLAIASAYTDKALPKDLVALGEVGLAGEVRSVNRLEDRVVEAKRLGYKNIITPNDAKTVVEAIQKLLQM
ncbi:DNA repair protein RadA [Patescibacteria group bacterium]|nr:DNA repair protein RadA [Patescibacteria group bacterium]MBU1673157.1 DNA repair protein RadA [Patescibacteria group bacterium]MBU1964158.1 DNA repair protein RadA [Patescibacteria group bacterium]